MTDTAARARTDAPAPFILGTFGLIFGVAAILCSLVISGYWGMGLGALGFILAACAREPGRGRTALGRWAVILSLIGFCLGLSAQLMMLFLMVYRGR